MPYIDSKVTVSLSNQKKEILKNELGRIITLLPGKSENYLMLGFSDNHSLYFRGEKLDLGAFIEVKLFGTAPKPALQNVTEQICSLYLRELNIPPDCIYIKYEEVSHWGYNSTNF